MLESRAGEEDFTEVSVLRDFPRMSFHNVSRLKPNIPYRIAHLGNSVLEICLALPGWDLNEFVVKYDQGLVYIAGKPKHVTEEPTTIYNTIIKEAFKVSFRVGNNICDFRVKLESGMLAIQFKKDHAAIPESIQLI